MYSSVIYATGLPFVQFSFGKGYSCFLFGCLFKFLLFLPLEVVLGGSKLGVYMMSISIALLHLV